MKRLMLVLLCSGWMAGLLIAGANAFGATSICDLKIVEFQTQAMDGSDGDSATSSDFVIVANDGPAPSPSAKLRYRPDGIDSSSSAVSVPVLAVGQSVAFVGPGIKPMNPSARDLTFPIAKSGGVLTVSKSTADGAVCDQVSWGAAPATEGQAAGAGGEGSEYIRKRTAAGVQDTGDNLSDFEIVNSGCTGLRLNEIQPYVVDETGNGVAAWMEISGSEHVDNCAVATKTGVYSLPADDGDALLRLRVYGSISFTEESGQVWLGSSSVFGDSNGSPILRLSASATQYKGLMRGQTWAFVDGEWRKTFKQTPGEPNIFQLDRDPSACDAVRINELFPNPGPGELEWIELVNEGEGPAALAQCLLMVGASEYYFAPEDVLQPHEQRAFTGLLGSTGSDKAVSLTDSGATVELWRIHDDGSRGRIQSVQSYTEGVYHESEPVTSAPEGWSYARFANDLQWYWQWLPIPTAGLDNAADVSLPPPGGKVEGPDGDASEPVEGTPGARIVITELLPNPAAPRTDETDEFVELFNLTDQPVTLAGYKLQVGNSYSYSFTFTDQIIASAGYLTITSGNSTLSLANSGGRARLLDPSGQTISESDAYGTAPEGESWAYIDGAWKWTSSPTLAQANAFTPPLIGALSKATAKKASSTKTSSTKAKAPSTKATKGSTTTAAVSAINAPAQVPSLHFAVLASVGLLAVLYAGYEYRTDIANTLYRIRRYRKDRRTHRTQSKGR